MGKGHHKQDIENQPIFLGSLAQKNQYLDLIESSIKQWMETELSIPAVSPTSWGDIYTRFTAVGKEMEYRTTYAAASSQVHNDAEDLINRFLLATTNLPEKYETMMSNEILNFSRIIIYGGLRFYLEAVRAYCISYEIEKPLDQISRAYEWTVERTVEIIRNVGARIE